jgi:hypothetical protein
VAGLKVVAGTVRVLPAGIPGGTSRVTSLDIAAGATLDLTDNALIVDYTGSSPLAAVQAMLLAGAIDTGVALPGAAVGIAEASRLFGTFPQNWAGQPIDSTALLLLQTLAGDTNLDRTVNFDDLLRMAQNYGASGRTWFDGDADYNGTVDFDDLLVLAQNYGGSVSVQETALLTEMSATLASDWALAVSLAPEPTTAALLLAPAALARRRRFVR